MVRGRISDWVVRPVVEAARPCPRPEDGTSEDPTAEDCTPEDCTCEGCTAQVCPPEDCTSKDNTSEDRSAEDCTADDCSSEEAGPSPDRWTVHGCSGPPATRRAGPRHGASFCHAAHSLREAADSPGILGSIHLFSDGRSGASPDLRREFELEYSTINGKCPMIGTSLDSASGRAVKGTDRKSAALGGPRFEPEASQLFLPQMVEALQKRPKRQSEESRGAPSLTGRREGFLLGASFQGYFVRIVWVHWCPAVREGYTPLRAPDESSPGRPSLAQAKTPLLKTALPKTAPVRAARLKSAPRKTAPANTTPLKSAPLKIAPLSIVCLLLRRCVRSLKR